MDFFPVGTKKCKDVARKLNYSVSEQPRCSCIGAFLVQMFFCCSFFISLKNAGLLKLKFCSSVWTFLSKHETKSLVLASPWFKSGYLKSKMSIQITGWLAVLLHFVHSLRSESFKIHPNPERKQILKPKLFWQKRILVFSSAPAILSNSVLTGRLKINIFVYNSLSSFIVLPLNGVYEKCVLYYCEYIFTIHF